jgi:hypothetical protein
MRLNVPLALGLGVVTVVSAVGAFHIWRFGYRRFTDEQIQVGSDIRVRLLVINGRASTVAPFAPFGFLTFYLEAVARGGNHESGTRAILTFALGLSFAIILLSGVLIFTLRSRAWPRRLVPPRLRTKWVSLESM